MENLSYRTVNWSQVFRIKAIDFVRSRSTHYICHPMLCLCLFPYHCVCVCLHMCEDEAIMKSFSKAKTIFRMTATMPNRPQTPTYTYGPTYGRKAIRASFEQANNGADWNTQAKFKPILTTYIMHVLSALDVYVQSFRYRMHCYYSNFYVWLWLDVLYVMNLGPTPKPHPDPLALHSFRSNEHQFYEGPFTT